LLNWFYKIGLNLNFIVLGAKSLICVQLATMKLGFVIVIIKDGKGSELSLLPRL